MSGEGGAGRLNSPDSFRVWLSVPDGCFSDAAALEELSCCSCPDSWVSKEAAVEEI